jgi:hypothetical protein
MKIKAAMEQYQNYFQAKKVLSKKEERQYRKRRYFI